MHGTTMVFLVIMPMAAAFAQLPRPAADRRPRRRLPPPERLRLLGLPLRRPVPLLVAGSSAALPTAAGSPTRPTPACPSRRRHGMDFWVARPADHRHRLAGRRHQPHRHRPQHAGAGHDASCACRSSRGWRWSSQFLLLFAIPVITVALFLLIVRAPVRRQLLQRGGGRRPAALAAPLLDLRPPGGLHPHPARLRHRVRGHPGLLPQAAVRLPVHGLLGRRHRLHGLGRVGPPHVRLRPRARSRWPPSRCRRCSSPCPRA